MSIWTDRLVAAPAWLSYRLSRLLGGSKRATWGLVGVLCLVSAIPTFAIGVSQRPTDLTFEDVRVQRIPANTTWVRLEGDLREVKTATGSVYRLYGAGDDEHSIVVTASLPLGTGPMVMTGRLALGAQGAGTIGFLDADVPTVPRRDEPFQLILLPAVIALFIVIGLRLGYPVVRRDRRAVVEGSALASADGPISAAWSGRIGRERVDDDVPITCVVGLAPVADLPEMADLRLTGEPGEWVVRVRRGVPTRLVRLCRIGGSSAGLEVHASTADVTLRFDDVSDRSRLIRLLR
jgi:hypothetical protein